MIRIRLTHRLRLLPAMLLDDNLEASVGCSRLPSLIRVTAKHHLILTNA